MQKKKWEFLYNIFSKPWGNIIGIEDNRRKYVVDEWNQFFATGRIQDYLKYRDCVDDSYCNQGQQEEWNMHKNQQERLEESEDEPDDKPGESDRNSSFY